MGVSRNSRHLVVDELPGGVLRVTRTTEGFSSLLELERVWTDLNRELDALPRKNYRLLVDTRNAPPRNDPEFERAFAPLRARLLKGFQRCAVLVRSSVGRLQIQRHAREDGMTIGIFGDEREALAYLERRD